MRTSWSSLAVWVLVFSLSGSVGPLSWAQQPEASRISEALDLRAKFQKFASERSQALWKFEDQLIQDQRNLMDRMRNELRLFEIEYGQKIQEGTDWAKAKRDYQASLRKQQQELKQQVKIRREELELRIMRFVQEQEAQQKALIDEMDSRIKEFSKTPGVNKARSDFESARNDLRESLNKFKERMRNSKPKENFWE
jgi:hypothetical protein